MDFTQVIEVTWQCSTSWKKVSTAQALQHRCRDVGFGQPGDAGLAEQFQPWCSLWTNITSVPSSSCVGPLYGHSHPAYIEGSHDALLL
jgi:hypothetical protein